MSQSTAVTAGTNATASQYNNLRTDAITQYRRFWFEIPGTLVVANDQATIVVPAAMTVTKIKHKVKSGSCTFRVQADSTDVKAGIAASTSYANETSISNPSITEGQELNIDITAVSSADTLRVLVYATETI